MTFDDAFECLLTTEGGYVDDKNDPGGETKYGISKRAYPNVDIKNLTVEQARAIYERDYWQAAGCDQITDPALAFLMFDTAVNQGVFRAKQIAGITHDPVAFQAERALHYADLPTFDRFGRGWLRRLFKTILQSGAKA